MKGSVCISYVMLQREHLTEFIETKCYLYWNDLTLQVMMMMLYFLVTKSPSVHGPIAH